MHQVRDNLDDDELKVLERQFPGLAARVGAVRTSCPQAVSTTRCSSCTPLPSLWITRLTRCSYCTSLARNHPALLRCPDPGAGPGQQVAKAVGVACQVRQHMPAAPAGQQRLFPRLLIGQPADISSQPASRLVNPFPQSFWVAVHLVHVRPSFRFPFVRAAHWRSLSSASGRLA